MIQYHQRRFFYCLALLLIIVLTQGRPAIADESRTEIESVLKSYLQATYARNTEASYALLSRSDRSEKSLETYRAENGSFSGAELVLSNELAKAIEFSEFRIDTTGERATVTFSAALPDANHPTLAAIVEGFNKKRLDQLDASALKSRSQQLAQLAKAGDLPIISSIDEQWDLVQENGQWRVFVNWADAIEVSFDAFVMNDLGWEFAPVQPSVLAQPGQTIEMAYRVKNIGPLETTGKARHIIGPEKFRDHLDIVACFCFLEQTLAPSEELEMPLVFRVSYDAPVDVKRFFVRYEFYPLESFPDDQLL